MSDFRLESFLAWDSGVAILLVPGADGMPSLAMFGFCSPEPELATLETELEVGSREGLL